MAIFLHVPLLADVDAVNHGTGGTSAAEVVVMIQATVVSLSMHPLLGHGLSKEFYNETYVDHTYAISLHNQQRQLQMRASGLWQRTSFNNLPRQLNQQLRRHGQHEEYPRPTLYNAASLPVLSLRLLGAWVAGPASDCTYYIGRM